jgi:hypothetical protein
MKQQAEGRQLVALSVADFETGTQFPLRWYCLNDLVMGGKSSSMLEKLADGSLRFSGNINTDGGGFASCRGCPATAPGAPITVSPTAKGVAFTVVDFAATHGFKFNFATPPALPQDEEAAAAFFDHMVASSPRARGMAARWRKMGTPGR